MNHIHAWLYTINHYDSQPVRQEKISTIHNLIAKNYSFVPSPLHAEALALKDGLVLAATRGYQNVMFESDSLQVISALKDSATNMSSIGHIIEDSNDMLRKITEACYTHVCRQANGVAHRLAPFALGAVSPFFWVWYTSRLYSWCDCGRCSVIVNGLTL